MIRKDKLPRPWGDDWQQPADVRGELIEVPRGADLRIVACDDRWVLEQMGAGVQCVLSNPLTTISIASKRLIGLLSFFLIKNPPFENSKNSVKIN